MPTTFANSINNNLIYADRAEHDAAGNDIATTYATKQEIPSVPVTDVEVDGVSVVSSGVASITMPTFTQAQANWNESDTSAASYIQNKPNVDQVYYVTQGTTTWSDIQSAYAANNDVRFVLKNSSGVVDALVKVYNPTSNLGHIQFTKYEPTQTGATIDETVVTLLFDDSWSVRHVQNNTAVQSDWNESDTGSLAYIQNKPSIPSGTQLVPTATSADADKVLTVDAQGTPAWASAQAPISAGNGIDITNNVVSVDTSVVATQTDLADKEDVFNVGTGLEMDTSGATPTLQVEAPVDIVAGPGIVIDNPDGNTLRVSTDESYETVLWSNANGSSSIALSEPMTNFELCRFKMKSDQGNHYDFVSKRVGNVIVLFFTHGDTNAWSTWLVLDYDTSTNTITVRHSKSLGHSFTTNSTTLSGAIDSYKDAIVEVVGIHRIANN